MGDEDREGMGRDQVEPCGPLGRVLAFTLDEMPPQDSLEQTRARGWGGDLIQVHRVLELLMGTDYGGGQSWRRKTRAGLHWCRGRMTVDSSRVGTVE